MASPFAALVMRSTHQPASIVRASCSNASPTLCLARGRQQCLISASIPSSAFAVRASSSYTQPPPKAKNAMPRTSTADNVNARRPASQPSSDLAAAAQQSLNASPGNQNAKDFSMPALDWETFFKLRVKRRRVQVLFSVTSSLFGGGAGAVFLSTGIAEPVISQIPLDPFMTLGLMTFAFSGMGWLAGPSIGNQVFYALNRKWKKQMTQKEAEFFSRIKKHRVDPSNSSAGNPVPDFYGEKIQSVKGYRQWLKDQKAFNKKKTANFL